MVAQPTLAIDLVETRTIPSGLLRTWQTHRGRLVQETSYGRTTWFALRAGIHSAAFDSADRALDWLEG